MLIICDKNFYSEIVMIDFSDCKIVPGRAYGGKNGNKIAVEYDSNVYMLKFPPSAANKPTELSYTNSCFSEHIASSIFNMLGIEAQKTMLGTFAVGGKQKIVCACKDFTADGKRLLDFCSVKNTVLESDSDGRGTELSDIIDVIDKQRLISPSALREHFWNMFIADALLGNFDRHNSNWGFLYDDKEQRASIAPVFDCASCLLPQADVSTICKVLTNKSELYSRIYQFPASAIKQCGQKINYYEFLTRSDDPEMLAALARIAPKVDLASIDKLIAETPYLGDLQRKFYSTYIKARYDLIIQPAIEIAEVKQTEKCEEPDEP